MNAFLSAGHDVYAYFNNDSGGHAPRNACVLITKEKSKTGIYCCPSTRKTEERSLGRRKS
jgi:uncharacterized protein YecE (DUF72 family)